VARSRMMPDAGAAIAHNPESVPDYRPEPTLHDGPSARATQSPARRTNGHVGRPPLRFPTLNHRTARPDADSASAPLGSSRPEPTFGTARARRRLANWLRGPRRMQPTDGPQFLAQSTAPRTLLDAAGPDESEIGREEFYATFPSLNSRAAVRPGWDGEPDFRDHDELVGDRWPGSERTNRNVPKGAHRSPRQNPRFPAPDNRWPDLPALLDEFDSPRLRASDEAALLAEQFGGTWSA